MSDKLVLLSYDALETKDLDVLFTFPYFSMIKDKVSVVKNVREIYPTLTYPIHSTIATGVYPEEHGIFHNQKPSINPKIPDWNIMGSDWYWEKKELKVPTLMDAAREAGKSVATVL